MYWEALLTTEEHNTIHTALLLELERNHGGDEKVVKLLQDALDALMKAKTTNSSRRV